MIKCPDNFIYSFLKLGRQIAQQMTKTRMIKREYAGSQKMSVYEKSAITIGIIILWDTRL